ncbi:MAG: cellulose biosynthesis cyclic di-GMP-binding regulatory protein BcsB [Acidimicrobiales bacterium]
MWIPSLVGLSGANARAASLASMQIAGTISQQYGTNTQVSIAQGSPPSQQISPLVRNVLVKVTPDSSTGDVAVVTTGSAPVLVVSGRGNALVHEAQAIGVGQLALATANNASGTQGTASTTNPLKVTVTSNGTREITFAQLGNQTSIEGLGTVDVTQFLSQAQFGTSIRTLQLRLQADYTPPPVGGVATFSVLVGGYIVASQRLSTVGSLVMNANVPVSVLSRTQSVDYRLDYSPPGGFCHAGLVPVQVTINPASGFAATPGETLPPGFARSPQNVAPGINVDLVTLSDANLIDACQLVTTLAQVLPYIPQVNLVPNSQMLTGHENEVIVGASRKNAVALRAPIAFQPFRTLATNGISIGYTVNQPFAALEAFSQNGRDVIMTGAYESSSLVNALTEAINSTKFGGWFGLGTGQIAVMTPDQRVRLVGSGAILTQLTAANPANNLGVPSWLLLGIALILAAIILRLAWFWIKMRRLRRAARREQRARGLDDPDATGGSPGAAPVEKRAPVTRIEVETSPRHKKSR